jgi:hypothetical protein
LTSSRTPVFLVNSRQALFAATPFRSSRKGLHVLGAPLLPKLRGQVAEFLRGNSLARLSILCPSTCVGLRYGQPGFNACEAISWQNGPDQFSPVRGIPIASQSWVFKPAPPDFPGEASYRLRRPKPPGRWPFPTASPPRLHQAGSRILTGFPSPTPFGLRLGAG